MEPSKSGKSGSMKRVEETGKKKQPVGASGHDMELKDLTDEAPPATPKTFERESRRDKFIRMKGKVESSVDMEEFEPEQSGGDGDCLSGKFVKITKPSSDTGEERMSGGASSQESGSGPTSLKVPLIMSRSTPMTFPQVVDQVRAQINMANVRRSSAIGAHLQPSFFSASPPSLKHDQETQTVQTDQMPIEPNDPSPGESQRVDEIEGVEEAMGGNEIAPQRRHSTGSASQVNRANLLAIIRRFRARRFRPPTQSKAVKYIQYFTAFLYYICMSPVEPESAKGYPKWVKWLQFVVFWILTASSLLQSLGDAKYFWVHFQDKETMGNFVTFGFYFANCLMLVYHVKLFSTSSTQISNLLKKIDKVNCEGTPKKGGWAKTIAIFIGTFAIFLSGLSTLFTDVPLHEWTFQEAVFSRAFELASYLFIWTAENYDRQTIDLWKQYSTSITSETKTFAAIASWINYFGILHSCIMLDLWPIVAIQIFVLQCHFTREIEATKKGNYGGRCPLSIHWKHYTELREVCDDTHKVFGNLIKLIHIQNIILCSYFLLQVLKKEELTMDVFINLISVIKIALTYYMVQVSADKNDKYEECIIKCSKRRTTIEIDEMDMNVGVLLKDMKKHPIGVGRGEFFVNEAFIIKFVATVGSIFLLISGEGQ